MLSPYSRIFTKLRLSALSDSFRHDISAASEGIRLTPSNDVIWAFILINNSLHIVTANPRLIVPQLFSFFIQIGPLEGQCKIESDKFSTWAVDIHRRRGHNKASIAVANKMARIVCLEAWQSLWSSIRCQIAN